LEQGPAAAPEVAQRLRGVARRALAQQLPERALRLRAAQVGKPLEVQPLLLARGRHARRAARGQTHALDLRAPPARQRRHARTQPERSALRARPSRPPPLVAYLHDCTSSAAADMRWGRGAAPAARLGVL